MGCSHSVKDIDGTESSHESDCPADLQLMKLVATKSQKQSRAIRTVFRQEHEKFNKGRFY